MCRTLFVAKIVGIGYTTSMAVKEIRVPSRGMRQTDVHMVRCVMSRYIEADALIAELQKDEERFDKEAEDCRKNSRNYTDCYMQAMSSRADGIRDAIVEVHDAPSIDIVRCGECYMCDEEMLCSFYYSIMEPDDFCSYGERSSE